MLSFRVGIQQFFVGCISPASPSLLLRLAMVDLRWSEVCFQIRALTVACHGIGVGLNASVAQCQSR